MSIDNPWSRYWGSSNLQSSFFSKNSEDEAEVMQFWQRFADQLKPEAKVLDLATGNGIILKMLLDHKPDLHIVGVDKAQISPHAFFKEKYSTNQYEFHSNVDIESLPFADESFDGVSSQFGIEYANSLDAFNQVTRVLRPYGRIQFLLHHQDSEPVQSSKLKTQEMDMLNQADGVMDSLLKFIQKQTDSAQLEAAAAVVLNSKMPRTRQITGQIFKSIDRILDLFATNKSNNEVAIRLSQDLVGRFNAQYARLMQMQESAKNENEMKEIVQHLESSGLSVKQMDAFYVGQSDNRALVGWSLLGYK